MSLYNWYAEYLRNGEVVSGGTKGKYSEDQKKEVVEYFLCHGRNISKTCRHFGYPCHELLATWIKEIASLERNLGEAKDALEGAKEQKVTQDNVYRFILEFGTVYKKLSEIQKKGLAVKFIEKVEIFPKKRKTEHLSKVSHVVFL